MELRVCFICPEYPDSANIIKQNHIHNPVKELQFLGVQTSVLDLWPSARGIFSEVYDGVPVLRFGLPPRGILRWKLYCKVRQKRLREVLETFSTVVDIFHIEFALVQLTPLLTTLRRKPLVIRCHGDDVFPSGDPRLENQRHELLNAADKIIGVSEYTRSLAMRYLGDPSRVIFIPNGVRAEIFREVNRLTKSQAREKLNLPKDCKIILMACSLIPRKGVIEVLQALGLLVQRGLTPILVIVGYGPEKANMLTFLAEKKLTSYVRFVEYVSDDTTMALYYRACDVYTMFSKTMNLAVEGGKVEGFGVSYIDANAAGRPVVGGNSGGVESAVIDGETGFLVDPSGPRSVELLAEKLFLLLTDTKLNEQMGKAGQERVFRELTWEHTARMLRRVYEELLQKQHK